MTTQDGEPRHPRATGAPRWRRLLLTGAAGEIGTVLRPALRGTAEHLRWHDIRPVTGTEPDEEVQAGDLRDPAVATVAVEGVDCLLHFAGIPRETGGTPQEIVATNVVGTHLVFEAARRAGVKRIVFASSNHVIGFYPATRSVGTEEPPRPSGHYGLSKVFGEAMGRLLWDKHGIEVACLRIGAFRPRPGNARELGAWISHADMARLARACVEAPSFGYLVLYGVSANRRARWGGDEAARRAVGYAPRDDAEAHAAEVAGIPVPGGELANRFHGGSVAAAGFEGDPDRAG